MMKRIAIASAITLFIYMVIANIYTGHWSHVYNYYFGG